jgi:putative PIN family toxin of toxin-antitoxin system
MIPDWVVDTNVFVSAALTSGGVCDQVILHAVSGRFRIAWNNAILSEYREVLERKKFGLSRKTVRALLASLPAEGYLQGVELKLELADEDDRPFLSVAAEAASKILVTGNPRHFPKHIVAQIGVEVISPAEALIRLEAMK